MEHFGELRQLLHTGQYENDGRQPVIPRSTRARPAQQPDTLVFSAQQHPTARPPLARTGVAATRSRRPPPAPVAPHQGSIRVSASRHAANRNDVDLYLAQLNYHQPVQQQHRTAQRAPPGASPPAGATATAAAAAQQPAPEQHRRAKRGKPMARRSLQALFDLAAEDSSTWQTSGASTAGGDTEDDGDTGFFASATSGDSSLLVHNNSSNNNKASPLVSSLSDADADAAAAAVLAGLPGPSTPANCDSGLLGEALAMGTLVPGCRPESPLDVATTTAAATATAAAEGTTKNLGQDYLSSIVPLRHLLMSERGRRLTALEMKAIVFRVAEDLAALHAANAVHRRVSIETISLTTCLPRGGNNTTSTRHNGDVTSRPSTSNTAAAAPQEGNGIAVAILPPGRSAAVLGSNRCYWALKDPVFDAEHAPPEVACCPVDRPVAFTPAGDMWALGVVLFSLLSAGRLPFSTPSCLCGIDTGGVMGDADVEDSSIAMTSTVDALQCRIHKHLHCQIDVINQLSNAQAAGTAGLEEEDVLEMATLGFDFEAKKLLLGLLHADPAQRFCAEDVLKHPWVAEAIPFVPKMSSPSNLPLMQKSIVNPGGVGGGAGHNGGGTIDGRRETPPPMSDVLRRTEQLGFTPQNANPTTLTAPAAAAECPYPIIGHVAQPLEVTVEGRKVVISALHAVYNVPGHGAMMSAAPLAVADPAEVSAAAAAAAAAANGHMHSAAEQGNTALSQFLNLGGAS